MSKPYYATMIKEKRDAMWMTQKELAKEIMGDENKHNRLSMWENGRCVPSRQSCRQLAKVLGGKPYEYQLQEKPQEDQ